MSILGDIATDIVARLESEVPALRRVLVLGSVDEFDQLVLNSPSAGVLIQRVENSDTPTPFGEEYAWISAQVWFTSLRFQSDEAAIGLDENGDGSYELFDAIHAALQGWTPTSAQEGMRFLESEATIDEETSLVVTWATYRTARLI